MNSDPPASEEANALEAMEAINGALHRLAMKVIVLEMALLEALSMMPPDQKRVFSTRFRFKAASAMQSCANKLMPIDDAEISLAVARILAASSASGKGSSS